jgi:hypothetical protein
MTSRRADNKVVTALLRERHGQATGVKLTGPFTDENKRRFYVAGYTRPTGERFLAHVRLGRDKAIRSEYRADYLIHRTACGMPLSEHRL